MPTDSTDQLGKETALLRLCRRSDIEMELMPDGSALLYDPTTDEGQALAPLAALIWEMLDGTISETELVAQIASDVPPLPQPAAVVAAVLADFRTHGLIEEA